MLKKSITYTNPFTEQEVTEEHYFHISKADIIEMEMEAHGSEHITKDGEKLTGLQAKLQRIIDAEDMRAVLIEFKDIIRRSYGKKVGDRFIKSSEVWDDFAGSEAYSQLIFDLCTDEDKGAEFMAGVIPSNLDIAVDSLAEKARTTGAEPLTHDGQVQTDDAIMTRQREIDGATPENPVGLTEVEVRSMDHNQLKNGLSSGIYKL